MTEDERRRTLTERGLLETCLPSTPPMLTYQRRAVGVSRLRFRYKALCRGGDSGSGTRREACLQRTFDTEGWAASGRAGARARPYDGLPEAAVESVHLRSFRMRRGARSALRLALKS